MYNNYNWFAFAGFLKHLPWNSLRYAVAEDEVRKDPRILAFKTPEGKNVFAITNRSDQTFVFDIKNGGNRSYYGYRYTPEAAGKDFMGIPVGEKTEKVCLWNCLL